jgi:hypothetical protein
VGLEKPQSLGDDSSPWFWNPGLIGVQLAPEWFRKKVKEIDENLEVAWDRYNERWQVWVRSHRINNRLCQGWLLLFPVQTPNRQYLPLDERTLAKIYSISGAKYASGKQYFDAITRETERDREVAMSEHEDEVTYKAGEYFEFTKPKVGFGKQVSESKMVGQ